MKHRTITDMRAALLAGTLTSVDLVEEALRVIANQDGEVHAYIDVFEDDARAAAKEADALLKEKGSDTPVLTGIPVAIKSNILIEGKRATAASKILENYTAPYNATVSERLVKAGAIFIGTTNMDEFAMGSTSESSAFFKTKNPLDLTRVPGGSSGGSAAAVAMGSVPVSLGTDTGGSVRLPASFCGLVGLKPTYGAVSRHGLIAMGSSLDQAGPLTHTVTDAELIHNLISGKDPYDGTSYGEGTYAEISIKETYRIGIPYELMEGMEVDVRKEFDTAIEKLKNQGHVIVDVSLPLMKSGIAAYYVVMPAEVSSNLSRYDGVRFGLHVDGANLLEDYRKSRAAGFGSEVKRRILLGTYVLSSGYYDAYYGTAEKVRDLMREEFRNIFTDIDCIVTPTAATPAFKIGEKGDPLSMYLADIFTVSANLTGVPALSVPGGSVIRDGVHLPIGIQFMAPHNGEKRLFDIGKRYRGE